MNQLIQIEKQLEQRSIQELEEIVNTFLTNLEKLRTKYGGDGYYNYVNEKATCGTTCIKPHEIKNHLLYMLKDNLLHSMVRYKSKELLTKLDLLS